MYKLIVLTVTLLFIKVTIVYSCPKSEPVKVCNEIEYESFNEKNNIITKFPSSKKMNRISLAGSHQSMTYLSGNMKNKTQELDILFQLKHGIRVIDMSVQAQNGYFTVYSGSLYLPQIFDDTMRKINKFLEYNHKEFIMLIIHDDTDYTNRTGVTNCKILDWYIQNNENVGWRMVKDWSFDDPIGVYRGKILLAAVEDSFADCAVDLTSECKFENSIAKSVEEKWSTIVNFQEQSYLEGDKYNCYVYNTSLNSEHGIRADTKYGGYFVNDVCVVPVNVLLERFFYSNKRGMFIVMASYPTPKLIERVNSCNNHSIHAMYYWESVKRKYLNYQNQNASIIL